ncbi:glycosyltransferase [Nitratireductor aquimarinus]|uniref:glycosyltransferase family 2 protein n=1 Tax=Nitratireductor aquimarinus TaxID=889300 RepID=UPI001A8F6404|nr:glycosyltransferase family 2 protein [Nitratireductor aquimarinus]MBN8242194.1 glycosyltransferase [Nitratireductor aquimarinus]MBY6130580.1 glycosyltransferase family 2 protein [Nitratireductor aquimarinus]MCA1302664.1 glycosyltransferase family 2 protein [Nitratireductor aquimarinus]
MKVAVLVPCYNEATTIAQVVRDFGRALPAADIYVYDNNSKDGTAEIAKEAGAIVRTEKRQGKGNVVRRMFADIEADVYLMVDGDATYDAASAHKAVDAVSDGHDMVNVARKDTAEAAYRRGHRFGNALLTGLVSFFFGRQTTDMLSGYKAFSRRFVKSFPAISPGFEIETELMVHALELRVPIFEFSAPYAERPEGSESKLSTYKDGAKILAMIASFIKNEKPLAFFSAFSAGTAAIALALGVPVIFEFLQTGLVPRLPTALLAASIGLISVLLLFTGMILDTVTLSRREAKRLAYLQLPSPGRSE